MEIKTTKDIVHMYKSLEGLVPKIDMELINWISVEDVLNFLKKQQCNEEYCIIKKLSQK